MFIRSFVDPFLHVQYNLTQTGSKDDVGKCKQRWIWEHPLQFFMQKNMLSLYVVRHGLVWLDVVFSSHLSCLTDNSTTAFLSFSFSPFPQGGLCPSHYHGSGTNHCYTGPLTVRARDTRALSGAENWHCPLGWPHAIHGSCTTLSSQYYFVCF